MKIKLILTILLNSTLAFAGGDDNYCEPTVIYKEKIVYVQQIREVPIEIEIPRDVTKKNRVSLLLLNGPSDSISTSSTPTSTTIRHEDSNAIGGQYMRDLGRFNVLIQADTNKNIGVGLGLNW